MAITMTDKDGSYQEYDTYSEFEQAMVLMSRISGNKVPQDLLDEVKAKNVDRDTESLQVKIDGNNFESAFREAIRDVGEELDRLSKDRTPISDECENPEEAPKLEVGDKVRVISADDGTSSPYHYHDVGSVGKVGSTQKFGRIGVVIDGEEQYLLQHHYEKLESLGKDANGEDLYEGDYVTGTEANPYGITNSNAICEVESESDVKVIQTTDDEEKQYEGESFKHVDLEEFVKLSDNRVEAKEKFDELNGVELEDSPTEFREGDLVRVTESFRDSFGDEAKINSVLPVKTDGNGRINGVGIVLVGDNHDKLRLVCRKEDRKDIGL